MVVSSFFFFHMNFSFFLNLFASVPVVKLGGECK